MKPILFNTEMIRAILEGRKTVTRRAVKFMFLEDADSFQIERYAKDDSLSGLLVCENGKPSRVYEVPYRPGDILYVRETWVKAWKNRIEFEYIYKANVHTPDLLSIKWKTSIHMPKEAARLFLRVTDVRVERLQEMTDDDFVRDFGFCREAIQAVGRDALAISLWDSTINPTDRALYGWDANPWVWVIEFERCKKPKLPEGNTGDG